jgi:hypothetical protein
VKASKLTNIKLLTLYWIWGSHSGVYEKYNIVVVTPCSSENAQGLGATLLLHLHGRRVIQAENRQKQAESTRVRFQLSQNYTELQPRGRIAQIKL